MKDTSAVIYARYSDGPNQTEQSIEGQVRDCKKYAEDHGLDIIDMYIDRAISGKEDYNRPEFQRLLHDSRKGIFSYVLTWKIDRFGRNREEIAMNKSLLRRNGVQLVYAMESIPEGPEGILLESLLEGMAEYYSADLRQKVNRGLKESARKGKVYGIPPYGYTKADYGLVIDEPKANIVREVFRRYADGETIKEITVDFNQRGLTNTKSKPFTASNLYKIISNRKYLGEYVYQDIVLPGMIPPIIDEPLWDSVQVRRDNNKKRPAAWKSEETFLLSGKIICGECGGPISADGGTSHTGRIYRYYKCRNKKNKVTSCTVPGHDKSELEGFVIRHTVQDVLTDSLIKELVSSIMKIQKMERETYTTVALRHELNDVNKAIKNIMAGIEQGIWTETTKDRLQELEGRRETLNISLQREELKKYSLTEDHILFWLESFRNGDIEDEIFQRKIVDVFVNQIIMYADKVVIAYNFCGGNHTVTLENVPNQMVRLQFPQVELCAQYPNSR